MNRLAIKTVALTCLAMFAGACSSHPTTGGPASVSPTSASTAISPSIAVSVPSAPTQPSGSLPAVKFDPCVSVGDSVIAKTGFDPSTRQRADQIHDNYAAIGCKFQRTQAVDGQNSSVGGLTIWSTNVTVDMFKKREGSGGAAITVNGRQAISYKRPAAEACFIAMTGPDGAINIEADSTAALTDWNACDHITEIANAIEPAIPRT